jgi:hypothetical protein
VGEVIGEKEVENKFGLIVMYTRGSSKENVLVLVIGEGIERVLERGLIVEKRIGVVGRSGVGVVKTRRQVWRKSCELV